MAKFSIVFVLLTIHMMHIIQVRVFFLREAVILLCEVNSESSYTTTFEDQGTFLLLTPWCRVLLEQLTGLQLVNKFPTFHGTRRFITALKSVRHLSLSWASPIQSTYPHSTSWKSILMLSTHLRLGLLSSVIPSPLCYLQTLSNK